MLYEYTDQEGKKRVVRLIYKKELDDRLKPRDFKSFSLPKEDEEDC